MKDGHKQCNLQRQDNRHAIDEIPAPGFMAEGIHADDAADASPDNSRDEQS